MRLEIFPDAAQFLAATDQFLLSDEASHNLILSLALMLVQSPSATPSLFAACYDKSQVCGAIIWVPGRKMVATDCPPEFADELVRAANKFRNVRETLTGILAPFAFANAFADAWRKHSAVNVIVGIQQHVMRLDFNEQWKRPRFPQGRFRRAWLEDLNKLRNWARSMVVETRLEEAPEETAELTRRMIEARRLFVWDSIGPVAMAGHSGNTPNGARINSVYTPQDQRRKGYARAVTWSVCEHLRQSGKKFVCLFADRHNPASVTMYEEMGFHIVGTLDDIRFRSLTS